MDTLSPTRSAVAKIRSKRGDADKSTLSLTSSSTSDDQGDTGGLRTSVEVALDKVRDRTRRKSTDEGREDSSRRLAALIPGRKKTKKTRKDRESPDRDPNATLDSLDYTRSANLSDTSLGREGSGHSSLLTDDNSDAEGKSRRPPLSPRQSHTGYLTLSSPEIGVAQASPTEAAPGVEPKSHTFFSGSTTSIPQIIEPGDDESAPPPTLSARSSSGVGRLKSAFSRRRSSVGTDSTQSSEGARGGLGGLSQPSGDVVLSDPSQGPKQKERASKGSTAAATAKQSAGNPERPLTPVHQTTTPPVNTGTLPSTPSETTGTPETLVTPPTPTDVSGDRSTFPTRPTSSSKKPSPKSSGDSIKHRRAQSGNIPSKLSQSVLPPLTPTAEEVKTPGGTLSAGFFTSFFGAAQKAADQLTNTINTYGNPGQKSKAVDTQEGAGRGGEEFIAGSESQPHLLDDGDKQRERAVDTLGRGDLSFSHLGISESRGSSPMNSTTELASANGPNVTQDASKKQEEDAANRAVSAAYEKPGGSAMSQTLSHSRPLSISSTDRLTLGDQTPPRPNDVGALKRSGSVRSKLSGTRRRHRASSATASSGNAGNSIGAALTASATVLANPAIHGAGHRLTGFAVASSKRNKEFHQMFRSVPEDDYLIEDYSAALQRDILLHGRLYVSEGHVCFSSNILGWVTNLVISFDEVVSVEKKSTAVIFPNAIVIQTLHARNTFASFVARDSTYELLIGIWKISHPNLKSSLNGVTLDDAGTGDKTEVADLDGSDEGDSETGSEDEVYDEDADDDVESFTDAVPAPSVAGSDVADHAISRKTSAAPLTGGPPQAAATTPKGLEDADAVVAGASVSADFPGPQTHDTTHCSDEHYDRPIIDTTIPAPLGKVYSIMFGPASSTFMRKWLVEDQKSRELNYAEDKTGLDNDHRTFTIDYIKPLYASIGPKQTKTITANNLVTFDLEKAISIDCSTQTPDVPSGNLFTVRTRYCLMWAPGNTTRLVATCAIEWSGKSWLKAPIEKGANDGQIDYVKSLVAAMTQAVVTKPAVKGMAKKGKRKGKKEVFDAETAVAQREASVGSEKQASNWGILEPLHQLLNPVASLVKPFATSQVVIAVLLALLTYSWFQPSARRSSSSLTFPSHSNPQRIAAYEEIWRREESSLWDWLEDRVGVEELYAPGAEKQRAQQNAMSAKDMESKLEKTQMNDRHVDDAIRTTEIKLKALKDAVARNRANRRKEAVA